jgi:hypothetical protein
LTLAGASADRPVRTVDHVPTPPLPLRRTAAVAAVALLGLGGLVACGDDDSSSAASGTGSTTTADGGGVDPNAPEQSPPGDIPDDQVFVPYAFPGGAFTVQVPEGWSRTEQDGTVTFTDNFNSIALTTAPASAAPTVDSATRDEVPTIAETAPGYTAGTVESVTRTAGDAVHVTYGSDSPPDTVTGRSTTLDVERYEFFHAGTEIVLTLSGPKGADNVDPWKLVTDSVTFGP